MSEKNSTTTLASGAVVVGLAVVDEEVDAVDVFVVVVVSIVVVTTEAVLACATDARGGVVLVSGRLGSCNEPSTTLH